MLHNINRSFFTDKRILFNDFLYRGFVTYFSTQNRPQTVFIFIRQLHSLNGHCAVDFADGLL
jgi:hypothetical protein